MLAAGSDVPVLRISGNENDFTSGAADGYLAKPFSREQLVNALQGAMARGASRVADAGAGH